MRSPLQAAALVLAAGHLPTSAHEPSPARSYTVAEAPGLRPGHRCRSQPRHTDGGTLHAEATMMS